MLASPVADEAEVLARMAPPVWVEDKYDGIRAQLHKQGAEVRLYSRDLHDISDQFPEVVADGRRRCRWDGILDGELLAWRDGMALPFLQLQARLGRKAPIGADPGRRCRSSTSPSTCWPCRSTATGDGRAAAATAAA